jgi:mono/diheme cytochrome c family protein
VKGVARAIFVQTSEPKGGGICAANGREVGLLWVGAWGGGDCGVGLKHKLMPGVISVMLGALLLACTAHKRPSRAETTLANTAKDVVIPIEAGMKKNPLPETDEVSSQGRQVFLASCALCHGADGRGETPIGLNMYPPAMDMTSPHVQHWSDAELFWIIENGVRLTGMPSWQSSISEDDTWKLARFIHNLPRLDAASASTAVQSQTPAAGQPNQVELIRYGKALYKQEGCFTCHQLNGEGGAVGPDLTTEGARGRTEAWLIGHFKNPPAYTPGSIMPPFENLTEEQLKALTTFLQNQKGPNN